MSSGGRDLSVLGQSMGSQHLAAVLPTLYLGMRSRAWSQHPCGPLFDEARGQCLVGPAGLLQAIRL